MGCLLPFSYSWNRSNYSYIRSKLLKQTEHQLHWQCSQTMSSSIMHLISILQYQSYVTCAPICWVPDAVFFPRSLCPILVSQGILTPMKSSHLSRFAVSSAIHTRHFWPYYSAESWQLFDSILFTLGSAALPIVAKFEIYWMGTA